MEIAVTAWRFGTGGKASELARQAVIAESMGFHSFWLPENHFTGPTAIPAPLMLLAGVAAQTERIGLGTTSLLLPIRHPIATAEEVAVLDRMSGGRVILGIGRGFQPAMFTAFDVPVADKRKLFKAHLTTMLAAWRGEPVAFHDGEPVLLAPLPVQQPHPPIWVAAFGPLALKQAGSLGLPYLASPMETESVLVENYNTHQAALAEPNPVVPLMRTVFVSKDRATLSRVRDQLGTETRRSPAKDVDDWAIVGDPEQVAARIQSYRASTGMTHLIARGRISGVEEDEQISSLELLLAIARDA